LRRFTLTHRHGGRGIDGQRLAGSPRAAERLGAERGACPRDGLVEPRLDERQLGDADRLAQRL
jgi:hypothetical protein